MMNKGVNARWRIVVSVLAVLAFAGTATAAEFRVSGGGGQLQIGGGLPLPIQLVDPGVGGNTFPTLLVPPNPVADNVVTSASGDVLIVPKGVLRKFNEQNTVGVFGQNPTLYAVATNLGFSWPATTVTIGLGLRSGATTTTISNTPVPGNSVRYSNALGQKFGGAARFAVSTPPAPGGLIPTSPVTVFAIAVPGAGNPPCTHTALTPAPFPGPGTPACVAALIEAKPNALAAIGDAITGGLYSTAPANVQPGIGIGKFGASPAGTVDFFTFTPSGDPAPVVNTAQSKGFPFTTGKITVVATQAGGAGETFVLSGADNRTAGGAGTIQLVAAALSDRNTSGPNANRGWVELQLTEALAVPTMAEWARTATVALMVLLTIGFFVVRRQGAES